MRRSEEAMQLPKVRTNHRIDLGARLILKERAGESGCRDHTYVDRPLYRERAGAFLGPSPDGHRNLKRCD